MLTILKGGKNYGYYITQKEKELSGGSLAWSDGMLYPVLHRLEKDGFIASEWIITDAGRRRKYYSITELAKRELLAEKKNWLSELRSVTISWEGIAQARIMWPGLPGITCPVN